MWLWYHFYAEVVNSHQVVDKLRSYDIFRLITINLWGIDSVDGAVIIVPACFNEAQRKAAMDAGQIAGLNVIAIISKPAAGALAFGIAKGTEKEQAISYVDAGLR